MRAAYKYGLDVLGATALPSWDSVKAPLKAIVRDQGNLVALSPGIQTISIRNGNLSGAMLLPPDGSKQPAWYWHLPFPQALAIPIRVDVQYNNGKRSTYSAVSEVWIVGGKLSKAVNALSRRMSIVGAFDVAATIHDLDRIKPMSVSQAKVLVQYGQKVIDAAIKAADSAPRTSPLWTIALGPLVESATKTQVLPGDASRQSVKWKLAWHSDALSKLFSPTAPYGAADDLKKWVQQAFIEFNAAEEGSGYAQANWDAMISDLKNKAVGVIEAPGKFIETVSATPWWVWAIVGTVGLGAVGGGYVFWNKLRSY